MLYLLCCLLKARSLQNRAARLNIKPANLFTNPNENTHTHDHTLAGGIKFHEFWHWFVCQHANDPVDTILLI